MGASRIVTAAVLGRLTAKLAATRGFLVDVSLSRIKQMIARCAAESVHHRSSIRCTRAMETGIAPSA
jgi:hypothetical protein